MGRVPDPYLPSSSAAEGTYINGALHWLRYIENANERYKICSFNLAEEKFEDLLQFPDCFNHDINLPGLGVSSNHFLAYRIRDRNLFEVWIMEEYGKASSWSKLLTLPVDNLSKEIIGAGHFLLCFTKEGKLLFNKKSESLIIYDHKENIFKTLFVENFPYYFYVTTYVESLVPPNDDNGVHD